MKKITTILFALCAVAFLTAIVTTPFEPVTAFAKGIVFLVLCAVTFLTVTPEAVLFVGLNKEIWLAEVKEGFFADDMFITECRDFSMFVDNDVINLAEAGISPEVIVNNTTYPIAVAERTDGALTITIDRFDTENQSLKFADRVELAYDKLQSIIFGHKQAMRMKFMEKGAHAIAPAANTEYTPLLTASGGDNGFGSKRLIFADIIALAQAFDDAEIPAEGRILVLTTQHQTDLRIEDITLYNQMSKEKTLYGFKLYNLAKKRMPRYNKTTGAKVAFGASALSTDARASFAFQKDEVCRAVGTDTMFHSEAENDPINRKDIIGFARRGIVIPIRNKGIAAIYSPAA